MRPITQICYWVVGRSIAIDLLNDEGIVRPGKFDEPIMVEIHATSEAERIQRGYDICVAIAQSHGMPQEIVSYDKDSTQAFA